MIEGRDDIREQVVALTFDDGPSEWTGQILQHLAEHTGAFISCLVAVAPEAGHVQKDIGHPIVRDDESESFCDIEPFDDASQLNEIGRRVVDEFSDRPWPEIGPRHF